MCGVRVPERRRPAQKVRWSNLFGRRFETLVALSSLTRLWLAKSPCDSWVTPRTRWSAAAIWAVKWFHTWFPLASLFPSRWDYSLTWGISITYRWNFSALLSVVPHSIQPEESWSNWPLWSYSFVLAWEHGSIASTVHHDVHAGSSFHSYLNNEFS